MKIKANKCPKCEGIIDVATDSTMEGNTPSSGDYTICIYCCTILQLDDTLSLKLVSKEKLQKLRTKPTVWNQIKRAQLIARKARKHIESSQPSISRHERT